MNDAEVITQPEQKQEFTTKAGEYLSLAESLEIDSTEKYQYADQLNVRGKKQIKVVKEYFKPMREKSHSAWKEICGKEKNTLDPIERGTRIIGQKMASYHLQLERKRKEEEARLAEEARIKEEEAQKFEEDRRLTEAQSLEAQGRNSEAEEILNAPAPVPKQMVAPAPTGTLPKTQTTFRDKWEFEVLDKSKVPEEYKVIDQGALNRVAQATKGKMTVAGCKVIHKQISVGRTN